MQTRTYLHSHIISNPASDTSSKFWGTLQRSGFPPILKERWRLSRLLDWLTPLHDISGGINFPVPGGRERIEAMITFFPLTTLKTHNTSSYTKMTILLVGLFVCLFVCMSGLVFLLLLVCLGFCLVGFSFVLVLGFVFFHKYCEERIQSLLVM